MNSAVVDVRGFGKKRVSLNTSMILDQEAALEVSRVKRKIKKITLVWFVLFFYFYFLMLRGNVKVVVVVVVVVVVGVGVRYERRSSICL